MQPSPGSERTLLSLQGIYRSFGSTVAVRGADLEVRSGTVHALLGENGAGKSTLMNVAFGVHPADSGTIAVDGRQVEIGSPRDALRHGIAMVHQHHQLIPSLTVAESLVLVSKDTSWRINHSAAADRVRTLGQSLGVDLDPRARVADLSLGDRQRLEILAALHREASVIILDEPTAVLAPSEVGPLFAIVRKLAASGRAVILITHRMREVFAVSDVISVMRQGELVRTLPTGDTTPDEVLELVIRRRPPAVTSPTPAARVEFVGGETCLEVRDAVVAAKAGSTGLRGCSLAVRAGEILGVVGVEGNGQHDLVEVLAGVRSLDAGAVLVDGAPVEGGVMASQIAVVPEDRHREGLVLDLSIEENLALPRLSHYTRAAMLQRSELRRDAQALIADFGVVTASSRAPVRAMSGGNQQKVVLGRALANSPRALVVSQATRGLDPGAAQDVLARIRLAAREGAAIIFIGSDIDEVVSVADRAVVMYDGRAIGETSNPRQDQSDLALCMVGGQP